MRFIHSQDDTLAQGEHNYWLKCSRYHVTTFCVYIIKGTSSRRAVDDLMREVEVLTQRADQNLASDNRLLDLIGEVLEISKLSVKTTAKQTRNYNTLTALISRPI